MKEVNNCLNHAAQRRAEGEEKKWEEEANDDDDDDEEEREDDRSVGRTYDGAGDEGKKEGSGRENSCRLLPSRSCK